MGLADSSEFYCLPGDIWKSLTVLATRETLHLLQEDHQWRKRPAGTAQDQTQDQDQAQDQPSSGAVTVLESLPISCVSSLHLWHADERRMDIELYDEVSAGRARARLGNVRREKV